MVANDMFNDMFSLDDLAKLQKELEKDFKSRVFFGNAKELDLNILPLGIASLDAALFGGFAFDRITGLYGMESSGKTLLALTAMKAAQMRGLATAYVDVEKAWTPAWSQKLGLETEKTIVVRPNDSEHALNLMLGLVRKKVPVIVFDSLAALASRDQLSQDQNEVHEKQYVGGDTAKVISAHMKLVTAENRGSMCIYINQIREKPTSYGDPTVMPGGRAFKFYCHQLLKVSRGKDIEDGEIPVGYNMGVFIEKNKQGAPHRRVSVPFMFSGEFDEIAPLLDTAIEFDVIVKQGANYTFSHTYSKTGEVMEKKFFGRPKLTAALKDDEDFREAVAEALKEHEIDA